jgi:hypothetical protein
MYTREARATREASRRGSGGPTGRPRGKVQAPWGDGEACSTDERVGCGQLLRAQQASTSVAMGSLFDRRGYAQLNCGLVAARAA